MSNSFASLGIPFPLFEGNTDDASEYAGLADCSICSQPDRHCFDLGIGCALIIDCPDCGAPNGLDADDRLDVSCNSCDADIAFPELSEEEIRVCYDCLRQGKAALTKDTELGMISWDQPMEGPLPGKNHQKELLRTPGYTTWQGERWQFCCNQPMIFVGTWTREDFSKQAPDGNAKEFFEQVVQDPAPGLWEDELHDETGIYVFRCPKCARLKAHWDIA